MIVISGASGRLAKLVIGSLVSRGVTNNVRLATRNPDKLAEFAASGFEIVAADFADPASLDRAFAGAETALLISATGPVNARITLHRNAFDAVARANVSRVVYTSRVNPVQSSLYPFAPIHAFSEAYLKDKGIPFTILRNNEYIENLNPVLAAARQSGKLMLPGARGKTAFISVCDIAEIAAATLMDSSHTNKTYELNGPEALDRHEIAALLSKAIGTPVGADINKDEFVAFIQSLGVPPFILEMTKGLYDAVDKNEFAKVWTDASNILGRQPRSVASHIEDFCKTA